LRIVHIVSYDTLWAGKKKREPMPIDAIDAAMRMDGVMFHATKDANIRGEER